MMKWPVFFVSLKCIISTIFSQSHYNCTKNRWFLVKISKNGPNLYWKKVYLKVYPRGQIAKIHLHFNTVSGPLIGKYLARWVRYRDIWCFPQQIAIFYVFRNKLRFLCFSTTDRDILGFQHSKIQEFSVKRLNHKSWPIVTKLDLTIQNTFYPHQQNPKSPHLFYFIDF